MNLEVDKYQTKLKNKINQFSTQFMSNTKWTKFFRILSINRDIIKNCFIKDVWKDGVYKINIPPIQEFSHNFYDKGIRDVLTGGPLLFKEIHWVEFPAEWEIERTMRALILEPQKFKQDIFKIEALLNEVGLLKIEATGLRKLIVYGYI
ncbi:hypothetical protein B2G47_06155 [Leptospira interrogans serovar Canicola]|nr:hypothetical protein B2G47_06155 [Leptospira interrogans serovar Canicola]